MRAKIKLNKRIIIVMLFFALFMMIQRMENTLLVLIYFLFSEMFFYLFLIRDKKTTKNSRRLFLIMLFFWFQEFVSAQANVTLRYSVYALEVLLIIYLMGYSLKHLKLINMRQVKITTIVLCTFLCFDLLAILITYRKISVFLYSAYDSCKYFVLIYYILSIRMSKNEMADLLELVAGIVFMHTFYAVMQFSGNTMFFDIFRGRFDIVTRMGSFRSIGMFPYGIELGNYSCVLFAIYYNFSKVSEREKRRFYLIIEVCLVICIITSGTRTSMANVMVLYIAANFSNAKQWVKTLFIILSVLIVGSNFIDIADIISRTKWDVSIELPRTYYMKKGIEIWKDHPFLGVGYNTYGSLKYRERTNDVIFDTYDIHKFDYANLTTTDSFIVEIVPEFGILGIFVIMLYGSYIFKCYRKKRDKEYNRIFIMIILSITIMSINTSTPYINSHIGTWFWIACGFLLNTENTLIEKLHVDCNSSSRG